jgi:UDP-N-acetylglucosamine--N-acetylmuramyl-(pentapeptide) pyrophosphoryl-undecaprenol N-acetylglucosamine transferase
VKILFAGGGTGGHVYLGIALARELRRRIPGCAILFVGTRRGLEARIVPAEGFDIEFIESAGLKGMSPVKLLRNLMLVPGSVVQSRRIVRRFVPDVVVGVGGYASGPVVLAAWMAHRRTLVVEPNAYPGFTNRVLAKVVDAAALALPDDGGYFGRKGVVTGIPVRSEFSALPGRGRGPLFTILIYGGSQGSHALNRIVKEALPGLKSLGGAVHLIHQTGEREFEEMRKAHADAGLDSEVKPFLPAIYEELGRADLVICRAGAGTVAELTVAGKAAILVPFPGAADDHQTKNALALQRHGAARMIPESEWEPGRLEREMRHFLAHPEEVESMENAARGLARPDATQAIANMITGSPGIQ